MHNISIVKINILDLCLYLLSKFRTIIISVVISMLLGLALCQYNNIKVDGYETNNDLYLESVNVLDENLKEYMDIAVKYRHLYEDLYKYKSESLFMNIDSNNVYNGVASFYLNAGEYTFLLEQYYTNLLSSDLANTIIDAANIDTEEKYILELLDYSVIYNYSDLPLKDQFNNYMDLENDNSIVLNFTFNVGTEELSNIFSHCLKDAVENLTDELKKIYGEFNIILIKNDVNCLVSDDIRLAQTEKLNLLNSYSNTISSLESKLSGDNLTYYKIHYLNEDLNITNIPVEKDNPLKWAIVGGFIGMFICVMYYFIRYLVDKSIKTVDELVTGCDLPLLGIINFPHSVSKGIDTWIFNKRLNLSGYGDYIESIKSLIRENSLICNFEDECKDITNGLIANKNNCLIVEQLNRNISDISDLGNYSEVIFVVKLYNSSIEDLQKDLNICHLMDLHIRGVIVFR